MNVAERTIQHRATEPTGNRGAARLRILMGWAGLFALGIASMVVYPLFVAPAAEPSLRAMMDLVSGRGEVTIEEVGTFVFCAFAILLIPYLVLAGAVAIERLAGRGSFRRDRRGLTWLAQAMFISVSTAMITLLSLTVLGSEPLFRVSREAGEPAYWIEALALFVAGLIVADMLLYWVHRAQHHFPWLWKFHAVHHSQQDLDVLHGITHPVEATLNFTLATIPAALLVRVDASQIFLFATVFSLQPLIIHMRGPIHLGPLRILLCDNRYHFIHHSRDPADFNSNFAVRFPFIDRLFGTYRSPRPHLPETGLADRAPPANLRQYALASWPAKTPVSR